MPVFSDASAVFNRPKKPLDIKSCGPDVAVLLVLDDQNSNHVNHQSLPLAASLQSR
jgi:hypothetical protein